MKGKRRYKIYFWIILVIFFIAFYGSVLIIKDRVFSYDTDVVHPNIVIRSALFFNKNSAHKLTFQQINWLKQGAIDEDKPLRWVNHFYDPINNVGYHSHYSTAKNWAKDLDRQRDYALGDHTWQNALDYYQKGNYQQAFTDLGHILHLIADVSVPAHTRDDSHPFGDSYEDYVKYNWYAIENTLNLNLNFADYKIDNLEKAFDDLAYYSNENFYSDDTIESSKYELIKIINVNKIKLPSGKYGYLNKSNKGISVYISEGGADWLSDSMVDKYLDLPEVMNSYSQHLLPRAIGYSAGVIDLFFREVNKNEKYSVIKNKTSWLGYLNYGVGTIVTGAKKLFDFGVEVKNTLVNSTGSVVDLVRGESAPNLSNQPNTPLAPLTRGENEQTNTSPLSSDREKNNNINSISNIQYPISQSNNDNNDNNSALNTQPINNTPDAPPAWYDKLMKKSQQQSVVNTPELEEDILVEPIIYNGGGGGGGTQSTNTQTKPQVNTENTSTTNQAEKQTNTTTLSQDLSNDSSNSDQATSTVQTDNNTTTTANNNETTEQSNTTTTIITTNNNNSTTPTSDSDLTTSTTPTSNSDSTSSTIPTSNSDSTFPTSTPTSSKYIKLNEILSNANPGDNEWVELYNSSTTTVDIDGWSICDSTLKHCKIVSSTLITTTTIPGESWFVFDLKTGRYLNNNGDSVILFNAVGEEIDRVIYGNVLGTPSKNQSLARRADGYDTDSNSNWAITNIITKGTTNTIDEDDIIPPAVPKIKTTVSSTKIIVDLESQDNSGDSVLYDLQSSNDNSNWQDVATSTSDSQFNIEGSLGQKYYFRARGTDSSGNISSWSDYNGNPIVVSFDLSREVVINEIAWAGTSVDYQDRQWIELYNNTSSSIDLSNWKIIIDGNELLITSRPSSTIGMHSYYLIERFSDKTIRDIEADLIYQKPGMKKNGSVIQLVNGQGQYIDQVNCLNGWFAGGGDKYASMKRLDPTISGDDKNNWASSIGIRVKGRGYSTEYVYGSPRAINQGFLSLNFRQLDKELTLDPVNNPYFLSSYEIPANSKLIIKPGVIIKSYVKDATLTVLGELDIKGDKNNRVVFTSGRDKTFASSSLNIDMANWNGEPITGDWQGIVFKSGSVGRILNTDIRYGGHHFFINRNLSPHSQVIRSENAQLVLDNVRMNNSAQVLVYLQNSSTTIKNSVFEQSPIAVQADSGQLTMDNIDFRDISDSKGTVQVNNFWPSLSNFTFSSTTSKTINFKNIKFKNQTVTLGPDMDFSFNSLYVDSSSTLNIKAGTTLNLPPYAFIYIYGKLNSNGTAQKPVNIGVNKGWGYMYLENAQATLSYTNFYGGGGLFMELDGNKYNKWYSGFYKDYMIELVDSDFDCYHCRFWNYSAPGHAIKSYNSSISLTNSGLGMDNKYPDNSYNYTAGIKADGGSIFLDNVNFVNLNYGIFRTGQTTGKHPVIIMQNMTASNWINVYKSEAW